MNVLSAVRKRLSKPAADAAQTAVSAERKEKTMATAITRMTSGDQIHGDRPVHVHQCSGEDDGHTSHTWLCNSPYCEVMEENCTVHHGVPPIRMGFEPWRGR
jgi:hypothetical protein